MKLTRAKHSKPRRGSGLATVLVVTAIMVTLSFTIAGLSFHHLSATNRMSNTVFAKDLAEAAIAKGIDQVLSNPSFGTSNAANVSVTLAGAPSRAFGSLTFDTAQAASLTHDFGGGQMVWRCSSNNIASNAAEHGDGIEVPGNSVFLSAVGYCQGTFRRVEAVIYVPKFPYAIASSGSITGKGLQITSLRPSGDPANKADWVPTSLATNSGAGGTAVDFSGGNIVLNGDLQSHTGATLGTNTTIQGSERLNANVQTLPTLKIANYDTIGKTGLHTLPGVIPSTTLSGYNRRQGNLLAADGLNMKGGVLFVNGNLNVAGGLSGSGAVIVNGTTNISGTTVFSGTNKVCILSHDSLSIQGDSPASPSQVTGVLYSDKSIYASYTQLRGTVVANDPNDPSGTSGKVGITDSKLFQDGAQTDVSIIVDTGSSSNNATGPVIATGVPAFSASFSGTSSGSCQNPGVTSMKANFDMTPGTVQASNPTPISSQFTYPASSTPGTPFYGLPDPTTTAGVMANIQLVVNKNTPTSRFLDPATGGYVAPVQFTVNTQDPGGNNYAPGTYKMVIDDPNYDNKFHYVAYTGSVAPMSPSDYMVTTNGGAPVAASSNWQPAAVAVVVANLNTLALSTRGSGLTPTESSIATSMYTAMLADFMHTAQLGPAYGIARGDMARNGNAITFQDALDPSYQSQTSNDTWSLSLNDNSIMPLAERVRVMYWRDTP